MKEVIKTFSYEKVGGIEESKVMAVLKARESKGQGC